MKEFHLFSLNTLADEDQWHGAGYETLFFNLKRSIF